MRASVIVRSKDEAPRLRLTLASLAAQSTPAEVVVVDDGSADATRAVIDRAAERLGVIGIHHPTSLGRSAASNAGAKRASGDILIFLDGDTLAGPQFVARHLAVHAASPARVARGETRHLRQTRFFADPATGSPMSGEEARVQAMSAAELRRALVTERDIQENFAAIDRRSQLGVYPGAGPRQLYELEIDALRRHTDCEALWAASSGANLSVGREAFLAVGGFDPAIPYVEQRELALRLCRAGLRMAFAEGARSYHMTHRKGWRDPLLDPAWEQLFYRRHPIAEVPLLSVLWASLADDGRQPKSAGITSLPALARAARRCEGVVGIEAVRSAHFAASAGP